MPKLDEEDDDENEENLEFNNELVLKDQLCKKSRNFIIFTGKSLFFNVKRITNKHRKFINFLPKNIIILRQNKISFSII